MDEDRPTLQITPPVKENNTSFEEMSVGNPGQRESKRYMLETEGDSNLKYLSATIGRREQHLVKQVDGVLYIFKADNNTLTFRRTEFELQQSQTKKNLLNDPAVILEFDSEIAEGLIFETFCNEGEYTCSLLVPLLNNFITQLYFTKNGLKLDSRNCPLTSCVKLHNQFLMQSARVEPKCCPGLLVIEPLGYVASSDPDSRYYKNSVKLAASHGDGKVYIYTVPLVDIPSNKIVTVEGKVIYRDGSKDKNLWSSLKDSILGSMTKEASQEQAEDIIEDLKYLGNDLMCLKLVNSARNHEARIVNLRTQNTLCSRLLEELPFDQYYQVNSSHQR